MPLDDRLSFKPQILDKHLLFDVETIASPFMPIYSDQEMEHIVDIVMRSGNRRLYDGNCVRLDGIEYTDEGMALLLSVVGFYDFVTSNLLYQDYKEWIRYCKDQKERQLLMRLPRQISHDGFPKTLDEVLARHYLGNILAISVLVRDSQNKVLLTQRNNRVIVSAGYMGVTSTGSVESVDLESFNPIIACAQREIEEEIGLKVYNDEVFAHRLIIAPSKLQPVVLCNVTLDRPFEEIGIHDGVVFEHDRENECYRIATLKKLSGLLEMNLFSDAAKEHLLLSSPRTSKP